MQSFFNPTYIFLNLDVDLFQAFEKLKTYTVLRYWQIYSYVLLSLDLSTLLQQALQPQIP